MRTLVFVFSVFLISCGSGSSPETSEKGTPSAPLENNNPGLEIYETNCIACHGSDGKLGVSGAADLSESSISVDSATMVVLKGRKAMAGFEDKLKPEEIRQVAEYIQTLRK